MRGLGYSDSVLFGTSYNIRLELRPDQLLNSPVQGSIVLSRAGTDSSPSWPRSAQVYPVVRAGQTGPCMAPLYVSWL